MIDVSPITPTDDERISLKFSVIDTGKGIPEDKRAEIFEKFSQADTSTTRAYEGTGLGLAIAKALVELMGGEIGVDSTPGHGSVFWFTVALPVSAQEQEEDEEIEPVDAKILIVDDHQVSRRILEENAVAWGWASTSCDNGAAALALLRKAAAAGAPYDAVIMDYQMPHMNGAQTVEHMRADADLAAVPVILLTSVSDADDGMQFTAMGVNAHLTKPVRSAALLRAVSSVIRDARQNAAQAQAPQAHGPAAQQTQAPVEENTQPLELIGQVDVLVAEDNEVNRLVIKHILGPMGLSLEMAQNGHEAVEAFRRFRPRIILMDVSMPEMNGYEATKAIRALEEGTGRRTPIIGVTAHAVKGDRDQCIAAGMDDYMSKPVSPRVLSEKITEHMKIAASNAA